VVITGIGLIASVGDHREAVWRAVCRGTSGVRRLTGIPGIPDGLLLGAPVDIADTPTGRLKVISLALHAAREAVADAGIDLPALDPDRAACAVSGHMGDTSSIATGHDTTPAQGVNWWEQWFPNSACWHVAQEFGFCGPRICHSTACASGLIDFINAVRVIREGRCDVALAGSAEAIHPLFAAGFRQMRVLADHADPTQACRPFDRQRSGFVMGEGAAIFVVERLSHALRRGARIYAEVLGTKMAAEAHHVTDLDADADSLSYLLTNTMRASGLAPGDLSYINAHGTGTLQNDVVECRAIRRTMGSAADATCISSTKAILGHLVNAAGSVELAITALALRDGFAPPTMNLTDPDPECDLDCIPLVGRPRHFEHALKVSIAFGGHLAAVVLHRWPEAANGFGYQRRAAA
jgi:3-oxoacyl-(acyl-carrier-protein) synthase